MFRCWKQKDGYRYFEGQGLSKKFQLSIVLLVQNRLAIPAQALQ